MKLKVLLSVSVLTLTGCSRGTPAAEPETAPSPQPRQTSIPDPGRGPERWTFSIPAGTQTYISIEASTIESQPPDAPLRDSVTVTTRFRIQPRLLDQGVRITGDIEQVEIRGRQPDSMGTLPLNFSGVLASGGLVLDSLNFQAAASFLTCNNAALSRITTVQRNLLIPPQSLTRNQTWTDSTTTMICNGPIPAQLTTVRAYRVLGEAGGVVVVERSDRTMASGEGSQGQHRITIKSRGIGSAQLRLDRLTGQLISSTGESRIEVTIGSSGRLQRFIQTVRESLSSALVSQ